MTPEKMIELAHKHNALVIQQGVASATEEWLTTFANAVIAAHTAELLKDVGEPVAKLHDDGYWTAQKTAAGRSINYKLHFAGSPKIAVYSAEKVAAAVAKAMQDAHDSRVMAHRLYEQRISDYQKRIATLESTLKVALDALNLCYEYCRLYHPEVERNNVGVACRAAIKDLEVLHG